MTTYTDPREWAIIRSVYFNDNSPANDSEMDNEERFERNLTKIKNNKDQT
jgi:hypothetical protein